MPQRVFISYAHESQALSDRVLEFSNDLRSQGIDSEIDQYEESPPEGWPKWMMRQIQEADFVLIVCSQLFFERSNDFSGKEDGLGVKWETSMILQQLYSMNTINNKFIPIIFDKANTNHIPLPLQPYSYYLVSDSTRKKQLIVRLKGTSSSKRPPLGSPPEDDASTPLKAKDRKSFFTTVVDVERWNKAKWSGMVFLSYPALNEPPLVGFLFKNEEYGNKIFSDLKARFGDEDQDEEIHLSFIRGISGGETQDYRVHLGTSLDVLEKKIGEVGLQFDDTVSTVVSRVHEMNPPKDSKNLDVFENSYNYFQQYGITNVVTSGSSLDLNFDNIIWKKRVSFTTEAEVLSDKNHVDQPAFAELFNGQQETGSTVS